MLWDQGQCGQSLFDPLRISKLKTLWGDDSFPQDTGCIQPSRVGVGFEPFSSSVPL